MRKSYPQEIRRLLYPIQPMIFGLLIAHMIATFLVYRSNLALLDKLTLLQQAEFGPLPGIGLTPPLSSLSAALAGGLFFTLSAGAGVVLLTMGAFALVTALSLKWKKYAIAVPGILWPALLVWANSKGLSPGLSAFLLLIPIPVWWACRKWRPRSDETGGLPRHRIFHFLLIAVLLILWASRLSSDVFINIKDNLLLTSEPGKKIVHLYYQYTLYPAEVFKSLSQKQINTCRLEGFFDEGQEKQVAAALAANDFFVVPAGKSDLTVTAAGDQLLFGCRGVPVISAAVASFVSAPGEILGRVSKACDVDAAFRQFTMFSLLGAAPLILYLFFLTFFRLLSSMLVGRRISSWLAPGLCFLLGVCVITYLDTPLLATADRQAAAVAIESGSRKEKIAALRYIHDHQLDISRLKGYRALLESDDFGLQYWLVRNLGHSRHPGAWNHIFRFLKADSPYLVCKAIEAATRQRQIVGKTPAHRLRNDLINKLSTSDNWYVQMNAYKTLRRMGWTPDKSG